MEVVIVLSIVLVVSALATPSIISSVAAVKMTSTAQAFASLLQDARMKAARDNQTYAVSCVQTDNSNPAAIDGCQILFIDVDGSHTLNTSGNLSKMELDIQVSGAVKFTTTPPSTTVDSALSYSPNPTAASVTPVGMAYFNARGLACQFESGRCVNITSANKQTGFLYYMTSRDVLGNTHYAAVSVSPSGRIKVWKFNGTVWS